jgi:hypothetical protein
VVRGSTSCSLVATATSWGGGKIDKNYSPVILPLRRPPVKGLCPTLSHYLGVLAGTDHKM